jgi:prepilin-type N-terminal cleavage/methylation domain-containing protein
MTRSQRGIEMKESVLKGFTLIEIIMVVVILGIIMLIAVPKFINFRAEAEKAAEDATIGAVQAGIGISNAAEQARK